MPTIDPAAVKAGDTVEAVVTPVGHAPEYIVKGGVWASPAGELFVGPVELGSPRVSLLAHQPAPEPVWKPGTTGTATVGGVEGVKVMRMQTGTFYPFEWVSSMPVHSGSGRSLWHKDADVTDFVPDEPRTLPTLAELIDAIKGVNEPEPMSEGDREPIYRIAAGLAADRVRSLLLRGESR